MGLCRLLKILLNTIERNKVISKNFGASVKHKMLNYNVNDILHSTDDR